MDDNLYKQTFDAAIKELSALTEERESLDKRREELSDRIEKVRSGVLALSPLIGVDPQNIEKQYRKLFPILLSSEVGLTDAVRKILRTNSKFMTALQIRMELKTAGYDTDKYQNILSSIYGVLKRLVDAKEVESGTGTDEGQETSTYKWKIRPPIVSRRDVRVAHGGTIKSDIINYVEKKKADT
jgi:hypothetical protein